MKDFIEEIIELAKKAEPDFTKFKSSSTKTDAAGKRVREHLLAIKKLAKEGRDTIQEKRKENKK